MSALPVNWVADNSHAERPSLSFLQRVYDYDAMLLLLPSRKTPGAYVVARRKQFGPGLTEAGISAVYSNPDTVMCVMHQAVPVCLMTRTGFGWNSDGLIRTLKARDLWAHGGSEKVADMLEAQEDADKAATEDGHPRRPVESLWRCVAVVSGAHRPDLEPLQGRSDKLTAGFSCTRFSDDTGLTIVGARSTAGLGYPSY